MYRKAGSQSALSGVLSGPYTGGQRLIDGSRLDRVTRERLVRSLGSRGDPSPIAYERPASLSASAHAFWGVVVATAIITYVFAIGFANPESSWGRQPPIALVVYLSAGVLFAFSLFATLRRRALLGGDALRPGKYLFPLDVVDIALPDASGRQLIGVRPLGDARDARIEQTGRRTDLLIVFEDAANVRFPLRGDSSGEVALRRLEHAQRLIEELTYASGLEQAFAHDLFFDLRIDRSWARVAPGAPGETKRRAPSSLAPSALFRHLLLGRAASFIALALAVVIGGGVFSVRRSLGEDALFNQALWQRTPEAMTLYIERGGLRRSHAIAVRDELLRLREEAALEAKQNALREAKQQRSFGLGDTNTPPSSPEACVAALRAKQAPSHPEVPAIMEAIIAQAEASSDRLVPIRFTRKVAPAPTMPSVHDLGPDLDARERVTGRAFERVFSETCPASIVHFSARPTQSAQGLDVTYEMTWTDRVYHVRSSSGPLDVHGLQFVFDVRLHAPGPRLGASAPKDAVFRLTMPPPTELTMTTRPRSLFRITGALPPEGMFDERVYSAMTARAFDRLYDELHGLFFDGEPRVPLSVNDALESTDGGL